MAVAPVLAAVFTLFRRRLVGEDAAQLATAIDDDAVGQSSAAITCTQSTHCTAVYAGHHDSAATQVWLALALWILACLGELRIVGQASFACLLWGSLFALPPLYSTCHLALDALVGEGLALSAHLLKPGVLLFSWQPALCGSSSLSSLQAHLARCMPCASQQGSCCLQAIAQGCCWLVWELWWRAAWFITGSSGCQWEPAPALPSSAGGFVPGWTGAACTTRLRSSCNSCAAAVYTCRHVLCVLSTECSL